MQFWNQGKHDEQQQMLNLPCLQKNDYILSAIICCCSINLINCLHKIYNWFTFFKSSFNILMPVSLKVPLYIIFLSSQILVTNLAIHFLIFSFSSFLFLTYVLLIRTSLRYVMPKFCKRRSLNHFFLKSVMFVFCWLVLLDMLFRTFNNYWILLLGHLRLFSKFRNKSIMNILKFKMYIN